jgi:hypothetical protein
MQFQGQGKPAVGIIFDCDMGNSVDDVLALAMLYALEGKNESRVVGVSVSKANLKAAALCETIGRFYGGEVSAAFGAVGRTLPVGLAVDGRMPEDTPMILGTLSKMTPDGKPLYRHGIEKLTDTAEVEAVIRNALTAQQDQNAILVLSGPANDLVHVLDLPGAKDLIARKVRYMVVAAGAYPNGGPEFCIKTDIPAARRVFAEWPTKIVAAGSEVGDGLPFPASSIEKDFAWSPAHPVVDAYRSARPMPYDAPSYAMAAALYAVRPQENYFKLSDPGTISVLDDGRTRFTPSVEGKHRYLILDPEQKERITQAYIELASAKPVPRQPRFRQQKKDAPAKKQE